MRMTAIRTPRGHPRSTEEAEDWSPRTALAGVAHTPMCGMFSLGVVALSSAPSGAVSTATLFVDNVTGTQTTGCSPPRAQERARRSSRA